MKMNKLIKFIILSVCILHSIQECYGQISGLFDSPVDSYPEDKKLGPKIFKNGGNIRKPAGSSDRETMLMISKGNTALHYANFTGYFVGFKFFAKKKASLNLQVYRWISYSDEDQELGEYELYAETGFYTTSKGLKTRFFDQSIELRNQHVIFGVTYKDEGNPIPYKNDDDCSNSVLYSAEGEVEESQHVYEYVTFDSRRCHRYAIRGIVLETDYANNCDMHIAPSESIAFIQSHTDFGVSGYPNNYFKCWLIRAESSAADIKIQSVVFEVEGKNDEGSCAYDAVRIYSMKWAQSNNIDYRRTKCGNNEIDKMRSHGDNYMYIEFSTDQSYAYSGFYIGAVSLVDETPFNWLALGLGLGAFALLLIIGVIIIVVICYRKKKSKKQPELIVSEKDEVVESDKEDDEDAFMINKAPLATAMLPKFLNKPMGRPGQKPVQPMLVQPQGAGKPTPLAAAFQKKPGLIRRDTKTNEYVPIGAPQQPGGPFMPKQPAGAPKLASFVTAVMKPQAIGVKGGVMPGQPQGLVAAGIASGAADTGLNRPNEPQVSKQPPDLSRFKSLWKKALIPGPARYVSPKEWTRPWARPLQTVSTPMATPQPTPRHQVIPIPAPQPAPNQPAPPPLNQPAQPGLPPPPQAPPKQRLKPDLPPGFQIARPKAHSVPAEANAEQSSVAYPELFTVVKHLNAANDPVKARSMWKTAAAMVPSAARYLPPSQWQRPWATSSNKVSPASEPANLAEMGEASGGPGSRPSSSGPRMDERPGSATKMKKSAKVTPIVVNEKKGLLDSDSSRSGSPEAPKTESSASPRSSPKSSPRSTSEDSTVDSHAEVLPKVKLSDGQGKGQSEC